MRQINRNMAFKSFFKKQNAFPNYKSKRHDQSYTTNNQGSVKFSTNDRYISIPKCSRIRIKKHRDFNGTIKSVTVSKTTDEKYYISLLVEDDTESINLMDNAIGLDLGIKDLIIDSNGNKYKNHKYLTKSQKKLAKDDNVYFIGTANNDDSTFAISDKVYDRSMVMNLDYRWPSGT